MDKPNRRLKVSIEIEADSVNALVGALKSLQFDAVEKDGLLNSVSGGYDYSWLCNTQLDSEMTHDKYFESLNQYLAETKS